MSFISIISFNKFSSPLRLVPLWPRYDKVGWRDRSNDSLPSELRGVEDSKLGLQESKAQEGTKSPFYAVPLSVQDPPFV